MRRWLTARHIPYWPLGHWLLAQIQQIIGHRFDAIAPLAHLPHLPLPGAADSWSERQHRPVSDAHRLHAAASHAGVALCCLPGNHERPDNLEDCVVQIQRFIQQHSDGMPSQ